MHIVATILAGGEGRRIGGGKALVALAGKPLIAHVAAALSGAEAIAVAGDARTAAAIGAVQLADPPGAPKGPLAGLSAGLFWAQSVDAEFLCVAPCDAPLLPRDLVPTLRDAIGDADAGYAETSEGVEPLISIWRVAPAAREMSALRAGDHPPLRDLLSALCAVSLPLSVAQAMNVNTPEDLARAEALLAKL